MMTQPLPYVIPLKRVRSEYRSLVGGKAWNLSILFQAGLPVPDGFCVTTQAFRQTLESSDELRAVAAETERWEEASFQQAETLARRAQAVIRAATLSPSLIESIRLEWASYEGAFVVRSSASTEDLAEATVAGQHESYLNVVSFDCLLARVKDCWASLWGPRAILYRFQQGLGQSDVAMAVLVQQLVAAEVAGVAFTANPMNGRRDELVVTATAGLGVSIVEGEITPDSFVLRGRRFAIKRQEVHKKSFEIVPATGGGTVRRALSTDASSRPVLAPVDLATLGRLTRKAEEILGTPQDVEWTYKEKRFALVQSRSITTLEESHRVGRGLRKWLDQILVKLLLEYFPQPLYPLDRSLVLSLVDTTLGLLRDFGFRPPAAAGILSQDANGSTLSPRLPSLTWQTPTRLLWGVAAGLATLKRDPREWIAQEWPRFQAHADDLEEVQIENLPTEALMSHIRACVEQRDALFASRTPYFFGAWISMFLLSPALRILAGKEAAALQFDLLGGLDLPTSRMNAELRKLAKIAASDSHLRSGLVGNPDLRTWEQLKTSDRARGFMVAVESFLSRYGGRTGALIPMPSAASWEEHPEQVLLLVSRLMPYDSLEDSSDNATTAYRRAFERLEAVAAKSPFRLVGLGALVHFLVERNRAVRTERDLVIYGYELLTRPIRRAVRVLGTRLQEKGILPESTDIRFLTLDEVERILRQPRFEVDPAISLRRGAYRRSISRWRTISAQNRISSAGAAAIVRGIGASRGQATGRARLILSEADFSRLQHGEILVCRATSPSWTPLFALAAAVVTDIGSSLSHAAIIAREYGIPAVLGTETATSIMRDGEKYLVDGTSGEIQGVREASEPLSSSAQADLHRKVIIAHDI